MLINFTDTEESKRWMTINDGVMGGVSQSHIEVLPSGTALFSGQLSLENNGGFVSIRRPAHNCSLHTATGVTLKVKGDGRSYQFRVKTDDEYDGIAYRAFFETEAGQWQILNLTFASFCASFRGRGIATAPVLCPEQIRQIGFLLADKQPGLFKLEIAWIKSF